MSSPPVKYQRYFDFTTYQSLNPDKPLPGAAVDQEFNRLKTTTDQIIDRLALIQRDDGSIQLPPLSDIQVNSLGVGVPAPGTTGMIQAGQLGLNQAPRSNAAVDANGNFPGIPYVMLLSNRSGANLSASSLGLVNDQNKGLAILLYSSGSEAKAGQALFYNDAGPIDFLTNSGASSPFSWTIGGTLQATMSMGMFELTGALRTTQIGINGGPRSNYAIDANGNLPVPFVIAVQNSNATNGAIASFTARNNLNRGLAINMYGSADAVRPNTAFFYTDAGPMEFLTNSGASSPFSWTIGGTLQATMAMDLLTLEKDLRVKRNLIVDGSYNPAAISTGIIQATQIGINQAPRSNFAIDASNNLPVPYVIMVHNGSSAVGAMASFAATNNLNKGLAINVYGSGDPLRPNQTFFYTDAGDMAFGTNSGANSPFTFTIGNTLQATFSMGLLALTGGLSVAGASNFTGGITVPAGSIPAAALVDGGVTLAKMAANSVDSSKIVDGTIAPVDLSAATLALITSAGNPRGAWVTGTNYAAKDSVTNGSGVYVCAVAHTSGVFAADLGAGKWFQTGVIYDQSLNKADSVQFANLAVRTAGVAGMVVQHDGATGIVKSMTGRLNIGANGVDTLGVDGATGYLFPLINNTVKLGEPNTARWANVYSVLGDFSGDVAVTGKVKGSTLAVPTRQVFLAVGAGTYNTPANCRQLRVRMKAGGGGGCSSGGAGNDGATGGNTIFNAIVANGAEGGKAGGRSGAGGANGAGVASFRLPGAPGGAPAMLFSGGGTYSLLGGMGGGRGGGLIGPVGAGLSGAANSGGGAAGGGVTGTSAVSSIGVWQGYGGGEGEEVELIINAPAASYAFSIGDGGIGGVGSAPGFNGGKGGSGFLIVDEIY